MANKHYIKKGKYKRLCNHCKGYYQGQGKKYCSRSCRMKALIPYINTIRREKSRWTKSKCKTCNKHFEFHPTRGRGMFCSRKCFIGSATQSKKCLFCKDTYYSNSKNYCGKKFQRISKFCSAKCHKAYKKKQSILNRQRTCNTCNKTFIDSYIYKKAKYCSLCCRGKAYSGNGNPNYKGIPMKGCIVCKKEFKVYKKTQRYCSRKCLGTIKTKRSGTRYELQAVHELRTRGYYATRTPASRGIWDVIAWNNKELLLIQVKALSSQASIRNYEQYFSDEITNMKKINVIGRQEFWIWIKTKGWYKIKVKDPRKKRVIAGRISSRIKEALNVR